jgi:hypothetical protein
MRDAVMAGKRKFEAAAQRRAMNGHDDGLGRGFDPVDKVAQIDRDVAPRKLRDVCAAAEE